jgi:uncharacterized protein
MEKHISTLVQISEKQVKSVLDLAKDGATIPFMSRYRKDATGGLDEVQIEAILDAQDVWVKFEDRRKYILNKLEELDTVPSEVVEKVKAAKTLSQIEDLYLPYKSKRVTRADKAKKLGLLGLAKMIMSQQSFDIKSDAKHFVKGEVKNVADAISGAKDIIAEWVSENPVVREKVRATFERSAMIVSKVVASKKVEAEKYKDYFDFSEPLKRCSSHRFLAMVRGENEKYLRLKIEADTESLFSFLERFYIKNNYDVSTLVKEAYEDAYKRLIQPSMETEFKQIAKEKADESSIEVFSKNLAQLLLDAPLGEKRVLAIDPGFKSGCKVVCLDEKGDLVHNVNIFPHPPQKEMSKAKNKLFQLIQIYDIEAIAIGDGTAGRETENMIKHMRFDKDIMVFVVREDGASIYSASSIGRAEFPSFDVTVRGAASIGRRLMDPLAELVKIDPKSLGIGQYQHDVNQVNLKKSLDRVVESTVNKVGVNLNTASKYLLQHISGLGPQLAENIVQYRTENKGFKSRSELKKVARMGAKAFEQSAGFLRISNAKNPLDNSGVHPESYALVKTIAKDLNTSVEDLIGNKELISNINQSAYKGAGTYTLTDLLKELQKPSRDPRQIAKTFDFRSDIHTIDDLIVGMRLPGQITNVTNFGAFVNIGIKENGMIHKSQIQAGHVEDPSDYLSLNQQLEVKVIEVDKDRKRVALTLKDI